MLKTTDIEKLEAEGTTKEWHAGSERSRVDEQSVLIDQIALLQGRDELTASVAQNVSFRLPLQVL